jgi:hypothetical protein
MLRTCAAVRGQRRFPDKSGIGRFRSMYLRLSRRMFVASCSLRPKTGRANGNYLQDNGSWLKLRMFFSPVVLRRQCWLAFRLALQCLSAEAGVAQAVEPFPSFPRTVRVQLLLLSLGTTAFVNCRSGTSSECQNNFKRKVCCALQRLLRYPAGHSPRKTSYRSNPKVWQPSLSLSGS